MKRKKLIIVGAAWRDFHNFNTNFRDNEFYDVVAFTAAQIPDIAGRKYPASLAWWLYPQGIPIEDESKLEELILQYWVDECILSYSDLSYSTVMHLWSRVMAAGSKFSMMWAKPTMIKSTKPVIAVVAVRTWCGKSQVSRAVVESLKEAGKKVVSIRHPMPYWDLEKMVVQRFAHIDDLKKHNCTIEEMEEYEPHIAMNSVIYSGVDYEKILRQAEQEADVIVWDGGNNDMPFYQSDLTFVVADALRPGHEISYYPGEVNVHLADVAIINKIDSAEVDDIDTVEKNLLETNPKIRIIKAESTVTVEDPDMIKWKNVLAIEDGPTLTHGDMEIGAATVAANRWWVSSLVDPRPYAVWKIKETFQHYPNIGTLLPAMWYGEQQMSDLQETINAVECDAVIIWTPINLTRFIDIKHPATRVSYAMSKEGKREIVEILKEKWLI